MNQHTKPAPRNRVLAGILSLVYVALMAFTFYLESTSVEKHWPTWVLIVAGVTWGAIMIGLSFLVVKYFFGLDLRGRHWQFSLRKMLLGVPVISVIIWMFTQLDWLEQRQRWRAHNPAAVRSTLGQAPPGLVRLFDSGISRIEIKNGTNEQIAKAKRLFPEATVVAAPKPDRTRGQ